MILKLFKFRLKRTEIVYKHVYHFENLTMMTSAYIDDCFKKTNDIWSIYQSIREYAEKSCTTVLEQAEARAFNVFKIHLRRVYIGSLNLLLSDQDVLKTVVLTSPFEANNRMVLYKMGLKWEQQHTDGPYFFFPSPVSSQEHDEYEASFVKANNYIVRVNNLDNFTLEDLNYVDFYVNEYIDEFYIDKYNQMLCTQEDESESEENIESEVEDEVVEELTPIEIEIDFSIKNNDSITKFYGQMLNKFKHDAE